MTPILLTCVLLHIQCALLYTTVYGQRRIRVINISLPCTSMLSNLFRYADLETQFTYVVKQGKPAAHYDKFNLSKPIY
jgi:hypothetical protein